jgi:nucleotide-binding universal stress UspA family protein
MTILCGTDFSGASHEAGRAAAALAKRYEEPLRLVHVLDFPLPSANGSDAGKSTARWSELFLPETERRRSLLDHEAQRLRELGCEVASELLSGNPEDALVKAAVAAQARLIVVASLGGRSASSWRAGTIADRLALASPIPVLVVRNARPFETWSDGRDGGQPLRVLCGFDFGATAEAAAAWVAELKTLGPCEVTAAHVYEVEREARRLGVDAASGEVESALRDLWGARLAERTGAARLALRQRPADRPIAEQLVAVADDERADLIVVGSHQRKGFARHWSGSVSYALLPLAATNVVVVPRAAPAGQAAASIAAPTRLLAVTDLSATGDRAVALAFAVAAQGAELTLLHVVLFPTAIGVYGDMIQAPLPDPAEEAASKREAERHLAALVPAEARARGIDARIDVVHASSVSDAVIQAAERHGSDLVCLATHAHGALASALLGSVAQEVVRHCGRPVLLVPPEV